MPLDFPLMNNELVVYEVVGRQHPGASLPWSAPTVRLRQWALLPSNTGGQPTGAGVLCPCCQPARTKAGC